MNNKNLLFNSVSLEWLDSIQVSLKPSSYAHYCFFVYNHINPYFQGRKFVEITNKDINQYIKQKVCNGRLDGKGGLSAKTIKILSNILKAICHYAEETYDIPYCIKRINTPKLKRKDIQIFPEEEQAKIKKYVFENPSLANWSILLSLYTGMRIGEICALSWNDIDMENNVINIKNTVQRVQNQDATTQHKTKIVIQSAKSENSIRKIPIPIEFKEKILSPLYKKYGQSEKNIYFVTGKNKCSEPRHLQFALAKLLEKCCIPKKNFHVLRHTFATNCIRMGFDVKTLSEILGHADVSITLNIYVHSSLEVKQDFMNLLKV